MTSKVFFDLTVSLDGYIAPDGMDMEHAFDPEYKQWAQRWSTLQQWIEPLQVFRETLQLGDGGETGEENDELAYTFDRIGANILGKNMFTGGEQFWPEEAPFHTPVFVLTHQVREPWVRPGGTTFFFINDGIESALAQARAAAGNKDIRISGGANVVQQYLNAGLVDEFTLHISAMFMGSGTKLFDNLTTVPQVRITKTIVGKLATHVTYEVVK